MKKRLIGLVVALLLLLAAPFVVLPMLGMSATDLKSNLDVGTGMGAKLACSARYITGLDPQQISSDLASYTPATDTLSISYDDRRKRVDVSLFGWSATAAQYRDGIGCTLEIGDTAALDHLTTPTLSTTTGRWPQGEVADAIRADIQALTDNLLQRDNAAGLDTRGLVVIHQGRLVAESYADGFDATTPLLGWSMGKSLTAILLGHLEMRGLLSVAETNLFPAWSDDERRQISVENLLQMSSGLDFSEVYAPGSDATHMLFTAHSASDVALASELGHKPGTHFSYSSGTTNMLARLLTERLGGPQAAINFLYKDIFEPLAMRHALLEPDPSGVFVASSYIYASPRDWARLGQLLLAGGVLNGTRLVSEEWIQRATQPNSSENDPRYGYQFWLNDGGSQPRWPSLPSNAYAMNGNRAQTVMVVPSADAVLVRLGWTSGGYPLDENFAQLLQALE